MEMLKIIVAVLLVMIFSAAGGYHAGKYDGLAAGIEVSNGRNWKCQKTNDGQVMTCVKTNYEIAR